MRAWRIYPHEAACPNIPRFDPLDGAGGRVATNRWNDPGHPVIYAAANKSPAALQTVANRRELSSFGERTIIELELDDDHADVSVEQLVRLGRCPAGRSRAVHAPLRQDVAARATKPCTPSFVMPSDLSILINPLHPKADGLRILRQ